MVSDAESRAGLLDRAASEVFIRYSNWFGGRGDRLLSPACLPLGKTALSVGILFPACSGEETGLGQ
jgi:hypothetical protein